MAGTKSIPATALLIPRFVHILNAMARKCGLAVDAGMRDPNPSESWDNQGRPQLVVIWRGTAKQLRETGLFPKSYHFPTGDLGQFRFSFWRKGRMFKEGRCWRIEVDCGECPIHIEQQGAIEVIHYEEETAFHGTRDALIAAKVCAAKHLPLKRVNKCWYSGRRWDAHKFHDGTYLFTLENEEVFKKRQDDERQEERARQQPSSEGHERREPTTAEEFRERLENPAKYFLYILHQIAVLSAPNAPFRFDHDTLNELREQMAAIMLTIRDGKIIKLREPVNLDRLQAITAAESDPNFQRFLGRLTHGQRPAA